MQGLQKAQSLHERDRFLYPKACFPPWSARFPERGAESPVPELVRLGAL